MSDAIPIEELGHPDSIATQLALMRRTCRLQAERIAKLEKVLEAAQPIVELGPLTSDAELHIRVCWLCTGINGHASHCAWPDFERAVMSQNTSAGCVDGDDVKPRCRRCAFLRQVCRCKEKSEACINPDCPIGCPDSHCVDYESEGEG